ncbi:hypothetical protein E3N88_07226 [Mikania micrantha]|uniref:Uncharacterized protein n=1 Tax=Mikania micrantha TaxID=192012 RepID=A0A5N6PTB0_9ASTR|nr:hypothetical protein E3N88_07226 [Mikania micrantha]
MGPEQQNKLTGLEIQARRLEVVKNLKEKSIEACRSPSPPQDCSNLLSRELPGLFQQHRGITSPRKVTSELWITGMHTLRDEH